ncbi:MAG: TIGR01777 family oxidoreductase [Gemmataceae bacterium]|jgi:uncharacterized protein (TIGR01777 family)|nr:TIGR01777 family oxidoreductase [Gemmataceae bacterium]
MAQIFITGGTGMIGRALTHFWRKQGHTVWILSRSQPKQGVLPEEGLLRGDPCQEGDWLTRLRECEVVVSLAGESIVKKSWTPKQKEQIRQSRVQSTALIAKTLAETPSQVKVWLSASGIGYYGNYEANSTEFIEGDKAGSGFLAQVALDWENATQPERLSGIRVVQTRIGIVLDRSEGFLPIVSRPFRYYLGGVIGTGQQWISWIHIQDLVRLFDWIRENPALSGPVNITAPHPVTHWGFCQTLAKQLHRPCSFRFPPFLVKCVMGEKAELATHGVRVIPQKAHETGFDFRFPTLPEALADLLSSETR